MAENKNIGVWKFLLEMGPIILFFITYVRIKDKVFEFAGQSYEGFIVATALFIPVLLASTGVLWWLTGKLSRMQVMTAVLVVVFGGMSLWFNDDRFFKMKPTIIYLMFGGALAVGLFQGKSYLRAVMEEAMPMEDEGWMKLTRRFCAFFLGLAATNEIIWRSFSTDVWVNFKTFGLTAALFLFFMAQAPLLSKYGLNQDES